MKNLIKRLIDFVRKKTNPISYSKSIGVTIGDNCKLNGTPSWGSEPWLIKLGSHTEISFGVTFITHDGATWVFREEERYKNVIRFGKITIGNNCFIGANSTILPNVNIGDNSIVGAGSLVTKNIPSGEVWGGCPAKKICTTVEYAEKCLMENPLYNIENFKCNKIAEVRKICKWSDNNND